MIKLKVVNEIMPEPDLDPFQKALSYHLKHKPKPNMTEIWLGEKIARILKRKKPFTGAAISYIKNGRRKGTITTRQAIAKAYGFDYCDFYNFGKSLNTELELSKKEGGNNENQEKIKMNEWKDLYFEEKERVKELREDIKMLREELATQKFLANTGNP